MSNDTPNFTVVVPEKDPNLGAYRQKIIENYPTLRDNFAMAALTGILNSNQGQPHETLALMCYEIADHMLTQRAKN